MWDFQIEFELNWFDLNWFDLNWFDLNWFDKMDDGEMFMAIKMLGRCCKWLLGEEGFSPVLCFEMIGRVWSGFEGSFEEKKTKQNKAKQSMVCICYWIKMRWIAIDTLICFCILHICPISWQLMWTLVSFQTNSNKPSNHHSSRSPHWLHRWMCWMKCLDYVRNL